MEELNAIVSRNLTALRQKSGLTQLQVAERINYSDKSISKWERGESLPDVSVLIQLAQMYEVSLDQIVSKTEKKIMKPKLRKISIHTVITLIAFAFVWFLSTIGFAVVYGLYGLYEKAWLSFIVAIPVSFLVVMILSFIWYPYYVSAIFSSIFLWTTVLAITECINTLNIWLLYVIAAPLQFIIIFGFSFKKIMNLPFIQKLKNKKQKEDKI